MEIREIELKALDEATADAAESKSKELAELAANLVGYTGMLDVSFA